jgi:hypothetical protein
MILVSKWMRGWLLLLLLSAFAHNVQSAPKKPAVLKEVIITNYVGDRYAKQDTPEYIARIVLRADGTALYFGNPTYAPRTGQFRGTFAPSYFTRISKLLKNVPLQKQRYKAGWDLPHDARTEFAILSTNGQRHHLTAYSASEAQLLSAVRNVAEGLSWKIAWQRYVGVDRYNRDLSGVRGDVLRGSRAGIRTALGVPGNHVIAGATLSLRTLAGKEIARGQSGKAGRFCLLAPPGTYYLVPILPKGITPDPLSAKQKVTVTANGFSDVVVETATRNSSKN